MPTFNARVTKREYESGNLNDNHFVVEFDADYRGWSLLKASFHFKENVKSFLSLFPDKKIKLTASGKTEGKIHPVDANESLTTFTIQETWEEVNAENT